MTAKAALCRELLDGNVVNIKNCFKSTGLTNAPREISRMVEQPFGVVVSRVHCKGKSKYGQPVTWVDYRMNNTKSNQPGIKKMRQYVKENVS